MKHCPHFIFTVLLFLHFNLTAQIGYTDEVIAPGTDNYHADIAVAYDSTLLIAGYSGNNSNFQGKHIYVRKYTSDHHLIWDTNLDSLSLLSPFQNVSQVQMLPLKNGTIVIAIERFECDVFITDLLVALNTNGQVIWTKELQSSFLWLTGWTPSTFMLQGGNNLQIYNESGDPVVIPANIKVPFYDIPLPGGNSLQADLKKVWRIDESGQVFGNAWICPQNIIAIDTLTGNKGMMVIAMDSMYLLDSALIPVSVRGYPGLDKYNIHPTQDGFLALRKSNFGQADITHWNENLEYISILSLSNETAGDVYSYFFQQKFIFWKNKAHIAVTLNEGDGRVHWLISSPVWASGSWNTGVDLAVNEIVVSGQPTGAITGSLGGFPQSTTYKANYSNVYVQIQNNGTDTIQSFSLRFRAKPCIEGFCGLNDTMWEKSYQNASLLPGEIRLVFFDSLDLPCTLSNITSLCIWATDINHQSDDFNYDNRLCKYYPDITSGTNQPFPLAFSLLPNPAATTIAVLTNQNEVITGYRIFSTSGTLVRDRHHYAAEIPVDDLPPGMYFLELYSKSAIGRQPLVIMR